MRTNQDFVICPKCGTRIENPGNYCPNCAAPILIEVRKEDQARQAKETERQRKLDMGIAPEESYIAPENDYYTFYGAALDPDDPTEDPMPKVPLYRKLRVFAALAFGVCLIIGLGAAGFKADFDFHAFWPFPLIGLGLAALLVAASFVAYRSYRLERQKQKAQPEK